MFGFFKYLVWKNDTGDGISMLGVERKIGILATSEVL